MEGHAYGGSHKRPGANPRMKQARIGNHPEFMEPVFKPGRDPLFTELEMP